MASRCQRSDHDWWVLYATEHIVTYRCSRCGVDSYIEKPHAG